MATTSAPDALDPSPYTPAGDLESILTDLAAVALEDREEPGEPTDDDVLPALDDALAELATEVDEPEGEPVADAGGTDRALRPEQAAFDDVAEATDVETVPFDDAATYLASDLYAVPPANTRFDWVDEAALA